MPLPPTSDTYINIKDVTATDIIEVMLYASYPLKYERYQKTKYRWVIMTHPPTTAKAGYTTKLTGAVAQNDLDAKVLHVMGSPISTYGLSASPIMDGNWAGPHTPVATAEIPWNYIKESWILRDFVVSIGTPPVEKSRTKKIRVIFR